MTEEFKKKFLTHSDHTGRQIVYSVRTGKSYYIGPIENYKHKIESKGFDKKYGFRTRPKGD
jgi:hypothetical protein